MSGENSIDKLFGTKNKVFIGGKLKGKLMTQTAEECD